MRLDDLREFFRILSAKGIRGAMTATGPSLKRRFAERVVRLRTTIRSRRSLPDQYHLIRIDPTSVDWLIVPRYLKRDQDRASVVAGDWDRQFSDQRLHYKETVEGHTDRTGPSLIQFDRYPFYQSLHDHFIDGVAWGIRSYIRFFTEKTVSSRYSNEDAIGNRLHTVDRLDDHMQENGYLTQRQLQSRSDDPLGRPTATPPEKEEVIVTIARDGER